MNISKISGSFMTDRPKRTDALLMDPNRYRILIDAVIDYAIYMLDTEGYVVSWNSGAEHIKGYVPDDVIGRHLSIFFTPEERAAGVPDRMLRTAGTVGRCEGEGWRIKRDGSRFWALSVIDAVRNDNGDVIGFAKVTRDITQRYLTEQRLAESERRFRMMIESVADHAIYMMDIQGRVSTWNGGAERILGYAEDEIVGRNFASFYSTEAASLQEPTVAMEAAARLGKFESEGWRIRKDGSKFWANTILDAIYDEHNALIGYVNIIRDITEKIEAQRTLELAREELFQAQKMEALGQLTGGVAHDFNNLLTIILTSAELAQRHIVDHARVERVLGNICKAVRHGEMLTKHLLAFSRKQSLRPELLRIEVCLESVANNLLSSLRGNIRIVKEIASDLWPVEVDPNQLQLAILNICLNARDAMPNGGTIVLRARNHRIQQKQKDLNAGNYVEVSIVDDGIGIPVEMRDRVFEPFFTTKEVGKGTGLGLSQAYGFAKQSGGSMNFSSVEGQGTIMSILLPAAKNLAEEEVNQRQRVLVVEDNSTIAELAVEMLTDAGYHVNSCGTAQDALNLLKLEEIDILVSDIVIPGSMNGLELAEEVTRRWPNLSIVLATGYAASMTMAKAANFCLLMKPYDSEGLIAAIEQSLAVRRRDRQVRL
ncbi:PAS domain S-box protein [Dongia soli]|uniref:histidine kinase n=1 Tax=Dongia soli TaxID=600628 RepID=A0ABU5E5T8_9PROT|nr:PAS domain S-box protein [Dongia soli]MDY0881625.1 PAS domain S-box protein [Dongia soli]